MPQILKAGGVWVNLLSSTNSPGDAEPPHSLCDHLQSVLQMNFVRFNISGWTLTLLAITYLSLPSSLVTMVTTEYIEFYFILSWQSYMFMSTSYACVIVFTVSIAIATVKVIVLYQPILYLTSIHSLHLQVLGTTFYSGTPLNGHPQYNGHFWKSWLFLRRLQKPLSSKHPTTPISYSQ